MWGRINGLLTSHFFKFSECLSSVDSYLPTQERLSFLGSCLPSQEHLSSLGVCLPAQEGSLGLCFLDCLLVE